MMKKLLLLFCAVLFAWNAQAQCDFIYVTPLGLPTGVGSMNDPMDVATAFSTAPSNSHIRMAIGIYTINSPLSLNGQNITVEGGFIDSLAWTKTSVAGATTIFRSNSNPSGLPNAPRIAAVELVSRTGFRFQDLTVQTDNAAASTQGQPYGTTVYGIYMDSCSSYYLVRCQVLAGNASAGFSGSVGSNGVNGNNGAQGGPGSCDGGTCTFSSGNAGGNGGIGGQGGGGVAGGAGGPQQNNATNPGSAGTAGTGRNGGGGAGGGAGGDECTSNNGGNGGTGGASACSNGGAGGIKGNDGDPGGNGTNGANGTAGSAGAIGSNGPAGMNAAGFWQPGAQAPNGADGCGGSGGGGGGGGGRQTCAFCDNGPGNGGAGGGGGGQGGQGGTGGYGGGSSFGIYINVNGQGGNMVDCFIQSGISGSGGIGGNGGVGGNGGTGGAIQATCTSEIGDGAPGGAGGAGGAGGKGGNGSNGITQAVYVVVGDTLLTQIDTFNLQAQPEIHISYATCSNASMQAQAMNANTVIWSFNTPANMVSANTNPASFSNGNAGHTTVLAQVDGGGNELYTDFIYISCSGETINQNQSICQGEQVLFNGSYLTQAGTYSDTLINAQGCDSILVMVLTVNQVNNTVSINPSNGEQLVSSNTGLMYQWINCATGTNLPGANGSSLLVTQNGTYAVISTDANGCSDTSNCITINYIGIDELASQAFSLTPNPVVDVMTVSFNEAFTGNISITDLAGKMVYCANLYDQKDWVIPMNVPQGIYFVNAENKTLTKTVRVVKL